MSEIVTKGWSSISKAGVTLSHCVGCGELTLLILIVLLVTIIS